MSAKPTIFDSDSLDWRERMAAIVDTMREMSRQTDAQAMVRAYGARMRRLMPSDASVSLSRRDLSHPSYRITRYTGWTDPPNPWRQKERLPVLEGGLLGEFIYGDEPRLIDDLRLRNGDPSAPYLAGMKSLLALPLYDRGVALNMVVVGRREPHAFNPQRFPEMVWMGNLFGRATHNLVLSEQVQQAYDAVDREMQIVADIQRSLLPESLPDIPTLDLAAYYQTSRRAGGDFYDFFSLPDGRWGILIGDVSGHGTPAAVIMAITHSIAHGFPGPPSSPAELLNYVNRRLFNPYTIRSGSFVTAFYGIYDPKTRELTYASAGHPPPRVKRCEDGTMVSVDAARGLPLCISETEEYQQATRTLVPGDQIVLYTDGITEAQNAAGEMFGVDRLDAASGLCRPGAQAMIDAVLAALGVFTDSAPPEDDRTMVVGKVK